MKERKKEIKRYIDRVIDQGESVLKAPADQVFIKETYIHYNIITLQ